MLTHYTRTKVRLATPGVMIRAGGIPEPLRADNQIRKKGTGTLKKKRATDLSLIDLRQLFLTELGRTAPEVIENLDQAQDISQWADKLVVTQTFARNGSSHFQPAEQATE